MNLIAEGFSTGLATGFFCLTACAPFLLPYFIAEGGAAWGKNALIILQFFLGRLAAYVIFSVSASLAGALMRPAIPSWVPALAMTATALLMLVYAAYHSFPKKSLCLYAAPLARSSRVPFAIGFLMGINVCPPFVAALFRLFALGNVAQGLLYFLAFFVATSCYILPVIFATPWLGSARLKNIGRMALLITGTWYAVIGIRGLLVP